MPGRGGGRWRKVAGCPTGQFRGKTSGTPVLPTTTDVRESRLDRDLAPNQSSAPLGSPGRSVGMRPGKSGGRREKETYVASKAIVGEKVGMTQVWDDQNRAVPVTVLKVAPVRVVQVKTVESDGYSALQVTWGFRRCSVLA